MRVNYCLAANPSAASSASVLMAGGASFGISSAQILPPLANSWLATWVAGSNQSMYFNHTGLTPGATYTTTCNVFVPTGAPAVRLGVHFGVTGGTSTRAGVWQELSITWTASLAEHFVGISPVGTATAGQQAFVTKMITEKGDGTGPYFDGMFPGAMFTGDFFNSASMQIALADQRVNLWSDPLATTLAGVTGSNATVTTGPAIGGAGSGPGGSYCVTPTGTSTASAAYLGGGPGAIRLGIVAGGTYTITAAMRATRAQTGTLSSLARSIQVSVLAPSTGASYVQHGSPQAANAAGVTTLAVTFTVPADATEVFAQLYCGSNYSANAVYWSHVLIEETPIVRPFFYGDTPNAIWAATSTAPGTPNASASLGLAIAGYGPAATRPAVEVIALPDQGVILPGLPWAGNPTYLTDRAQAITTSRGRQYELDTDQASLATLTVENTDGALIFSQVAQVMNVATPITIQATWADTTYIVWTGQISTLTNTVFSALNNSADIECVDGFDYLSNRIMRAHTTEAIMSMANQPDWYLPLSDAVGSTQLVNSSPSLEWGGSSPVIVAGPAGAGKYAFGASGMATNDSGTAFGVSNAAAASGVGVELELVGPHNPSGYTVGAAWSAFMIVSVTDQFTASPAVFELSDQISVGNSRVIGVQCDKSGGISISGTVVLNVNVSAAQMAAGVPICFGYDGTNIWVQVLNYGRQSYASTQITPSSPYITVGGLATSQFAGDLYFQSSAWSGAIQHFAMWGNYSLSPTECTALYNAFVAWPNETVAARLARIGTTFCGMGALQQWTDNAENQYLVAQPEANNSSALAALQRVSASVVGRYAMNESNQPLYSSRYHGQQTVKTNWALGQQNGVTYLYSKAPQIQFDSQHLYNDIRVTLQSGLIVERVNSASVQKYGQRLNQINTDVNNATDAGYLAGYVAGAYGAPIQRIAAVTLDASADPRMWLMVLGVAIDQTVAITYTSITGATYTDTTIVEKVDHHIGPDTWTVDLQLAPVHPLAVLPSMYTTLTTAIAAVGATNQFVLAPLPDSGYNPAEASLGVGSKIVVGNEMITIASVESQPNANATNYASILVTATTNNTHTHSVGDAVTDVIRYRVPMDPSAGDFDSRMVLDETARLQW